LIRDDRHLQALEQATAFLKCQADVLVPELFSGEYADFTRSPGRTIGVNSIRMVHFMGLPLGWSCLGLYPVPPLP
jgi:hypothetical protein